MDFYKRAAAVCKTVPYGKAASYGQIALLCGKPKNARQVGYALNHRLTEEGIPAHRIVNGQGYLTGAGAFASYDMQRKALESEGVTVSEENRVDLKRDGWHHTLEDALDFRRLFEETGI